MTYPAQVHNRTNQFLLKIEHNANQVFLATRCSRERPPAMALFFKRTRIYTRVIASLVIVTSMLFFFGCGGSGSGSGSLADDLQASGSSFHPSGWASNSQHSIDFKANPQYCKSCHGDDLRGGTSGVSCLTCHHGGELIGAAGYPGHTGKAPHNDPETCGGCHGTDFDGNVFGNLIVPSCFVCHEQGDNGSGRKMMNPNRAIGVPDNGVCAKSGCHPNLKSHPSHTGENNRGPSHLECEECHDRNPFFYDIYADGEVLDRTGVCDECHSPGGAFDGVDDTAVGAKQNWEIGVYVTDQELRAGKKSWCLTCHDNDPFTSNNEAAIIDGVYAPSIAGDQNYGDNYGYNITGHKISCLECHNGGKTHIDGLARTYEVMEGSPPVVVNGYTDSYRLRNISSGPALNLPRLTASDNPINDAQDFALCLDCHNGTNLLQQAVSGTNFWQDDSEPENSHYFHLRINTKHFDSDWDGVADSFESCNACHNVHGPPNVAMIRHGELISTPGTTDKVPALNFSYLEPSFGGPTATATYTFTVAQDGNYNVWAWWRAQPSWATDTPFTVNFNGGSQTIRLNQEQNGGVWYKLGTDTFPFVTTAPGSVVLGNDADDFVVADAIKVEETSMAVSDIIMDEELATYVGSWTYMSGMPQAYDDDYRWHPKAPAGSPNPDTLLEDSVGGIMDYAGEAIWANGVCDACHEAVLYERDPKLIPKP